MRKHLPLTLVGATEAPRRHRRDAQPPKMGELRNLYSSPSDGCPALRPDLGPDTEQLLAMSEELTGVSDDQDFLAAVVQARGTEQQVWLSRLIAYTTVSGVATKRAKTYTTGTIAGTIATNTITGTSTEWVKNAWPGCLVKDDGDTHLYRVAAVLSDTEIEIDGTLAVTVAGAYTLYQVPDSAAAGYLPQVQFLGNNLMYAFPQLVDPIDPDRISGPFCSWISELERDWTATAKTAYMDRLAVNGDLVVGVGGSTKASYSTDGGETWADVTPGLGPMDTSVRYLDGWFWCFGNYGYKSADGANWDAWTPPVPGLDDIASSGSVMVLCGGGITTASYYRSTNGGTTWTAVPGPLYIARIIWTGSHFIAVGGSGVVQSSPDGETWRTEPALTGVALADVATDGTVVVAVGANGVILRGAADSTGWEEVDSPTSSSFEAACYDAQRGWFVAVTGSAAYVSMDGGFSWTELNIATGTITGAAVVATSKGIVTQNDLLTGVPATRSTEVADFSAVSSLYRGNAFAVLGAYMLLGGLMEHVDGAWEYKPNRVRWSAPGTVSTFSGDGASFRDLPGQGAVVWIAAAGGRFVVGRSDSVDFLALTGDIDVPFAFGAIENGIHTISNPVVVEDVVYFVRDDGVACRCNGSTVEELGEFDLTAYEDWEGDPPDPVQLSYSGEFDALVLYRPTGTDPVAYLVSRRTQAVTSIGLPTWDDNGTTMYPQAVFASQVPSERRLYVSYGPVGADATHTVTAYLEPGSAILGKDTLITGSVTARWAARITTGELWPVGEGKRATLHELLLRYHAAGGTVGPDVGLEMRAADDSEWRSAGDAHGTITAGTSSLTGSGTAFAADADYPGGTCVAVTFSISDTITLPCLATQALLYTLSGAVFTAFTSFTITGAQTIQVTAAGTDLWAFWGVAPIPQVCAGDLIRSPEGLHRITAITTALAGALAHYPTVGATAFHVPAKQMGCGADDQMVLGVHLPIGGTRLRLHIVPRDDASSPEEVRLSGALMVTAGGDDEKVGD